MQNVVTNNVATNEVSTQKGEKGMKKMFKQMKGKMVAALGAAIRV